MGSKNYGFGTAESIDSIVFTVLNGFQPELRPRARARETETCAGYDDVAGYGVGGAASGSPGLSHGARESEIRSRNRNSQPASQLRLNVGKSQASGKLFEKSPYLWRKALIRCAHVSMCDTCTVVWVTQHSALATSHQPIHPTVRHSVAPRFVTTPVRRRARWGENANVNRQTLLRIGSKFMGWVGSAWMGWDDVLPYSRSRISLVSCSAGGVAH